MLPAKKDIKPSGSVALAPHYSWRCQKPEFQAHLITALNFYIIPGGGAGSSLFSKLSDPKLPQSVVAQRHGAKNMVCDALVEKCECFDMWSVGKVGVITPCLKMRDIFVNNI